MKRMLLMAGTAVAVAVSCQAVSREVNAIRADAVETLCRVLPDSFVSRSLFSDAMQFIEKELDPAVHQKLLELQDEADKLNAIKTQMLAIPGVTPESPAIQSINAMLNDIAKKFNDLLYNGGFFNWRTLLSAGAGLNVGLYTGLHYKKDNATTAGKVWHGLLLGFAVAMIIEFSLRGRKARIARGVFDVFVMVVEVFYKVFKTLFGRSGAADKWLAGVEAHLREAGAGLDKVFNNRWGALGITGTSLAVAGLIMVHWRWGFPLKSTQSAH